jgi:hypothetical protein
MIRRSFLAVMAAVAGAAGGPPEVSPPPPAPPGFDLGQELGRGGMGSVSADPPAVRSVARGVPFAVEEDVGPHPGHQPRGRRLGRPTLPSGVGDLIEQSGLLSHCGRRRRSQNSCGHGSLLRQGESPKGRQVNFSTFQRSLPVKEKMVLLALPT